MGFLDEISQHFFRDGEVGNDAVLHGSYRHNIARRPAKHILGLLTDGLNLICNLVDSDDRGFIDDDAATFGIDQSICRTQVNRQLVGE